MTEGKEIRGQARPSRAAGRRTDGWTRRRLLLAAGAAATAGLVLWWSLRQVGREQPKGAATPAASAEGSPVAGGAPARRPAGPARFRRPDEARPGRRGPINYEALHEEALARRPGLRRFEALRRKTLRTGKENLELQQILRDATLIDQAREDLRGDQEQDREDVVELGRMMQTDFLGTALAWYENPERARVLISFRDVLSHDNVSGEHRPEALRKSFAGDKFELYQSYLAHAPAEAARLQDESKGTALERILSYADKRARALDRISAGEDRLSRAP